MLVVHLEYHQIDRYQLFVQISEAWTKWAIAELLAATTAIPDHVVTDMIDHICYHHLVGCTVCSSLDTY